MALTPETFLAGIEMVQQQLRIKRDDQWSAAVCKLKFASFCAEFPEVNDPQFFWACEQWIQRHSDRDFVRFPTWVELMVPLYASENGKANRSWGFKRDLPQQLKPTAEQIAQLPTRARSIAGAADPHNADAYQRFKSSDKPLLPSVTAATGDGLTPEQWATYLRQLAEEADGATD